MDSNINRSDHQRLLGDYNNAVATFVKEARAYMQDEQLLAELDAPSAVPPTTSSRLTWEQERQLIDDYSSGSVSLSKLSLRYLIPKSTLHRWLRERGVSMRPRGGQYHRRVERSDEALVVRAYERGLTYKEIGGGVGADPSIVSKVLRRQGVTPNRSTMKSKLNLGAVAPPYNREKLQLLGMLWASLPAEAQGSSAHEIVLRHRDRTLLEEGRRKLMTSVSVKPTRKALKDSDTPTSTLPSSWLLRVRSARLDGLLRQLDIWKLPHLRSFFTGVVIRLAKEFRRGETIQVVIQGRAAIVEAVDRYLRGLMPGVSAHVEVKGNRARLSVRGMGLEQLFKALEDPMSERATPSEVSPTSQFLAAVHTF